MDERARGVASIIESIAARTDADAGRIARAFVRACWPGDVGDLRRPGAVEWVRRWGPDGPQPFTPECSCAAGGCRVCN
jgi:hypothetical protein